MHESIVTYTTINIQQKILRHFETILKNYKKSPRYSIEIVISLPKVRIIQFYYLDTDKRLWQKAKIDSNAALGFEDKLWHAADLMRDKLPAAQYRQMLMGLLFLRYVSDAFKKRYKELKAECCGVEEDHDAYIEKSIFFVPPEARWEGIAAVAHKPETGQTIDDAMRAIEKDNPTLKGVLPKFYSSADINKAMLGDVIDLFSNELQLGDVEANRDLLGRTYEYCIKQFAEYEGKKGGEYYTPASIVRILVVVLRPASEAYL